jgi:cardiolipin synthase
VSHIPFVTSGSYPVRPGNVVRPLIDGVPTFRRIAEVIEAAQHSVWLTVAFFADDFRMPGGSLFDVLDRAVARGLDVRVIFWRPNPESIGLGRTFSGSQADRDMLTARGSRFCIRWDRAYAHYLHHQKSWLVDAGRPTEVAFVGGINLTAQGRRPRQDRRKVSVHHYGIPIRPSETFHAYRTFRGSKTCAIFRFRAGFSLASSSMPPPETQGRTRRDG